MTATFTDTANQSSTNMKCQRQKIWLMLICSSFCFGLVLYMYITTTLPEFNQYHLVRTYPTESMLHRPRTILLWNGFFGDKRWGLPNDTLGPAYFRDELHCPVYQCELTNDKNFLPKVEMFDAVVFHTAEMFPLLRPVPSQRNAAQLYVFALMEPPGETKHILKDEVDFYNLTMTYRLDSDIIWPYAGFAELESGVIVAPAKHPQWRKPPLSSKASNDSLAISPELWARKTRFAAWFVSHCKTLSQREDLAAALQNYVDVDIFGKCGPKSCERSSPQECNEMLDEKYKFYLSFENSLCTDYVTEKFFTALQRQIVPVVFGGADYTRFAPPHSYIDAENFESAESLTTYLKYLSEHPEDYAQYFWWRQHYRLVSIDPFCELCELLHSAGYQQKSQTYHNIEKWWLSGSCRFKAKIKF